MFVSPLPHAMNRSILAAFTLALTSSVLGCGASAQAVDFAARTSDGRIWLSGTNGFGAVESGGLRHRMDYPMEADGSYDAFQFPAANILELRGRPLLVTRLGELMEPSADGKRWQPLSVQPEIGDRFNRQVDYATVTRDGLLFLHVHSDRLLWVAPGEAKPRREETMPSYMEHVTLGGDTIVGLGYRGSLRVVMERVEPGRWRELGLLPSWGSDVRAFAHVGGRWVAPTYYGVFVHGVEGGFYRISTDELVARSTSYLEANGDGAARARTGAAPSPVVATPETSTEPRGDLVVATGERAEPAAVPPSRDADPAAVARDPLQVPLDLRTTDPRSAPKAESYIVRAFDLGNGRLALEVAGQWTGFLVLSEHGLERLPCTDPRAYNAVGVVASGGPLGHGLIAVSHDASTYEVSLAVPGGCRALAPGMITQP